MTDFRILGPVEVSADGRVIEIGGPRLRRLLAILLLHANEPIPRGTLVYDLWGDEPQRARRAAWKCTSPGSVRLSAHPCW
jgi:DNA-binding SARP family transcriptional activator